MGSNNYFCAFWILEIGGFFVARNKKGTMGVVEKDLKKYYTALGLTRADVAKEINVQESTVDGYERGNPIPLSRYKLLFRLLKLDEQKYNEEYESALREAYSKLIGIMVRSRLI